MKQEYTTRIEKYKTYRQEIENQGEFLSNFEAQSGVINNYKKKIDALNPNILSNATIQKDNIIVPLISVNKVEKQKFDELKKFKLLINDEKISEILSEYNNFIYRYENNSIIDHQKQKISEKWLNLDPKYVQLKQIEGKLKLSEEKFKHFVENSSSKIETLNQVIAKSKKDDAVGNLNEFEVRKIDKPKNADTKTRKYLYYSIISLFGIILFICLILVIVTVCKRF